jgi:hypothetical protein
VTLQRHERSRFSLIEEFGDPGRRFAIDAAAVEEIDRAIELQEDATEGFQFLGERFAEGKRSG